MKKTRKSAKRDTSSAGSALHERERKRQRDLLLSEMGPRKMHKQQNQRKGDPENQNITTRRDKQMTTHFSL